MKVLVDTHVLLWAAAQPERLPPLFRKILESPDNEVFFSAASIWEVAIKLQAGRLPGVVDPLQLTEAAIEMGFDELPVTAAHAATVAGLPLHHRDPFDRLLVAQAMHEPARLLTVDKKLERYSHLVQLP